MIASPIYGRVDKISLQVGQVVNLGDVTATVSNPNQDQTSLTGLRLERLDWAEKLNNTTSVIAERSAQLEKVKAQIDNVKDGVLSELSSDRQREIHGPNLRGAAERAGRAIAAADGTPEKGTGVGSEHRTSTAETERGRSMNSNPQEASCDATRSFARWLAAISIPVARLPPIF
ncbi:MULTISPECIES: hypothetical protein [unclassified Rhizobium]|uniref:hypothetical protein n=1 Tax=unclassified Rhizobium TaxID=2613769 RepID=UPI001FD892C7|nr:MULTISPECIES: hypothetical protein [unclassified Rhizobium]